VILGDRRFFSREHYEAHKGLAPAYLSELVVHCLELVSQLAHAGVDFRFKGGNSLLVLLESPRRFSIDVDIITMLPKDELTRVVEGIVRDCDAFTRVEPRAPKTKPWLPMISYKLFFDSFYQPKEDAYVMLDAVLAPPAYDGVTKPVRCGEIYVSEASVELPSVSGLIADKLLCIGPSTTGIPLGKNKEAQRLKHVFDVGLLSQHPHDHGVVREALHRCLEQENALQKSAWTWDEVAHDTARFLTEPHPHDDKPDHGELEPSSYLYEIVRGFDGFQKHVFRGDYTWERLREDCRAVHAIVEALRGSSV
jgi:hypothetical protein